MKAQHTLRITLAAACSVALAACSSSGGAKTTSAPKPNTGSVAAPTGAPIPIGVIGSFTGPLSSSNHGGSTVATAWESYVNKDLGGINGHPVKVFIGDDQGTAAKASAAAAKLIQDDHVVSVVVADDLLMSAYLQDILGAKVPVVSGGAGDPAWHMKAGMFPTETEIESGRRAEVFAAKKFGGATSFANVRCVEVAACAETSAVLKSAAESVGVKFTDIGASLSATSYTAICLKLQSSKVDYVQLTLTDAASAKFVQDCQQQGYSPKYGTVWQTVGPNMLKLKNFTAYGPSWAFPAPADAAPTNKYRDIMKQYASGDDWSGGSAEVTWQGLEMLRAALQSVKSAPTAATTMAALGAVKDNNLGGLLANTVTYEAGAPMPASALKCYFVIQVKNGEVGTPAGLTPQCPSS